VSRIALDGFAVVEEVFDTSEIDSISEALARTPLVRSRAGARHAMQNPSVADFVRDARLLHLVRGVFGPEALPFRATLFDKSPTSNWLVAWHQDTALPLCRREDVSGWGPWSVKSGVIYAHAPAAALDRVLALRIHLDDSTASNGPLRVLPGTHRHGVLSDAGVRLLTDEIEPVDCLVARGGVLAMRPLLVHASSKSRTEAPRRVLHVEYAASMAMDHGLELAVA
jgi:ectoine hydroxylase-related dioxygenase (phytanoyl-CoA dioxygenase family)